jgi:N-acetylglucosamine-6-phosphate deacetylase
VSLADNPGVLAGSVLAMDRAVANMVTMVGITLSEAVTMASATPAAILGIDDRKGRLEAGFDADITVLDSQYNAVMTIVRGKIVFNREGRLS